MSPLRWNIKVLTFYEKYVILILGVAKPSCDGGNNPTQLNIVQFGRTLRLGRRGCRFKSYYSDHGECKGIPYVLLF